MNRKEFFKKLPKRFTKHDRMRIAQAYWLAKETHRRQNRRTGERYFEHCRRVAWTSLRNRTKEVTPNEVIASLIHDCWEDGFLPQDLIKKLFGASVGKALDALSKITLRYDETIGYVRKKKKGNQKYYHAIKHSRPWIRRIKIADRIDNLKDIDNAKAWTEEKRKEYITETEKYILPIAEKTDTQLCRLLKKKIGI